MISAFFNDDNNMSGLFFNNTLINTAILRYLEIKLAKYNNIKYAYSIMNKEKPANFSLISNHDKRSDASLQTNLRFIEPLLSTALHRITPFSWDTKNLPGHVPDVGRVIKAGSENILSNGRTFVLHDQYNNLAMLSLMMEGCDSDTKKNINSSTHKIQMVLVIVHDKLTALYQQHALEKDCDDTNNRDLFSTRENQILYWASVGKSYQEIGMILNIKLTTVKYHIGKAIKKLGVTNAKHAIRLAMELKLIRPVLVEE